MYKYSFLISDPEGIYSIQDLISEIEYTDKQFAKICENALLEYGVKKKAREEKKKNGYWGGFWCDPTKLPEHMTKAFKKYKLYPAPKDTARYNLEPYWGKDLIKNRELKKLIKESIDAPWSKKMEDALKK